MELPRSWPGFAITPCRISDPMVQELAIRSLSHLARELLERVERPRWDTGQEVLAYPLFTICGLRVKPMFLLRIACPDK